MSICELIEQETGQPVTLETPIDALHVDSLEFVDLMMNLSEIYGKEIPTKKLAALKTVGDIARELA